jgi:hypothetical protein
MVRVAAPKPAAGPARASRASNSTSSSSGSKPANLADLEDMGDGAEVFNPSGSEPYSGGSSNPLAGVDPRLIYGIGAGIAIVLLFGLYIILRPTTPDIAVVPPPPTVSSNPAPSPVVTPAPQPTGPVQPAPKPIVIPTTNVAARPAWMSAVPTTPHLPNPPITDEMVEKSIRSAVSYLKSQISGDQLVNPEKTDMFAGQDALVTYSLLHAGEAIDDSELSISDPFMQGLLNRLKQFPMNEGFAIYDRSLRASALAMFERDADKQQLRADMDYLLKSEFNGHYGYNMPKPTDDLNQIHWDNSNSQYGVLGIWAGVLAGETVRDKYWSDVEHHWIAEQDSSGSWDYQAPGGGGSTPMTCAGITTLCVTAEQQELIASKGKKDAHPQMSAAVNKGIEWLGKDDHLFSFNAYEGYTLYGVERAALATGFRWFGPHDWYRELGALEINKQKPNGSWDGGNNGTPVDTAFRVLFLSRGRQPLLMDKLRFDGDWNDRPRDVAKLTQFASAQLEKPFAWGVADLSRNWWDWLESPLLFITTDTPPDFSDDDCAKLRAYTDAGGLLFLHNEYASKNVDQFAHSLAQRLYPEYPMTKMAADDIFYSSVFPMKTKPPLMSISNGTRTLMVYSPTDFTDAWVRYKPHDKLAPQNAGMQMGLNLFVAAAGKNDFRNRLNSPYEEAPTFEPTGAVPLLQIQYPGLWNPEPKAYDRFSRWFQKQTSLKLDVQPANLVDLNSDMGPVAVITGNTPVDFSKMDLHVLHDFVAGGGVLLIDATGGSKSFADSIKASLMPRAFPGVVTSAMPASHPILAGAGACMDSLPKPRVRRYATALLNASGHDTMTEGAPPVEYATVDKGTIIISDLDITTALLNSGTYGIYGYTPAYSQSLVKNVILWALSRYHHAGA